MYLFVLYFCYIFIHIKHMLLSNVLFYFQFYILHLLFADGQKIIGGGKYLPGAAKKWRAKNRGGKLTPARGGAALRHFLSLA